MDKEYVIFNSRDELNRVKVSEIVYFEAYGNYTNMMLSNKQKVTLGLSLGALETGLAERFGQFASRFMRIGKSFIVNMSYISRVNVLKQSLILTNYTTFTFQLGVSKEALRAVKTLITKVYQQ